MNAKQFSKLVSIAILLGTMNLAQAASIFLSPSVTNATVGDTISLDVIMDFSDVTTLGGGFDIAFDAAALSFLNWAPNPIGDPSFSRLPDILSGLLSGFAVGDFNLGLSGIQNLGSLEFLVTGNSSTVMAMDTLSVAGPFVDFNTFGVVPVDYTGAQIEVSAVPVPAAIWLFGTALIGLAGVSRRK